ncbi:MCE family protein [Achromobacter denitrificans]|uniref:PqiB family protein n=1 Tax=Achromobacter denitrificans TaxID=32002 RepID=UPI000B48B7B4|nr:MlaD family protein [Achromobacter denitrificans]MDX3882251.1 MlaD family protein [Achromobacter sp.]ASC66966.1 paraquat-inducible protein B [Achromobacter denitrificans]MBV2157461.1 MCE family protein [Achromobacter denitrificans]MDF3847282.1 MlaD family protein [Achromobacter denitrificans]MDF3939485.1 MlaD family protein [Achromobacter denitrificans]
MSEQAPGSGEEKFASPTISRKQKSRISWIWLVPIVAALMGLSLVVRTWMQAGPDISISFNTAEGLEVGKTQLRYKDVTIGTVKSIGFNSDRTKVVVQAELAKEVSDLAREGTNFWVVRPRLDVSGVSGLGTLLSGAYIGVDAVEGKNGNKATKLNFEGLEVPPAVTHDRAGKRFKLKASDLGSLDIGSPVYFRRINVGRVIGYALDQTGKAVNVEVFVDAPNDKFVTNGTRFWNASGVDFSVNADGLKVRTQSLVSMAVGGVAFEPVLTARDAGTPAAADAQFDLYPTETAAKANPDGEAFPIRMRYDQSIRGLAVGAPIDFSGITLGNVTQINLDFDPVSKRFYSLVDATLYPERLGRVFDEVRDRAVQDGDVAGGRLLGGMIKHGLRAQLRTANLLTGQLYVALDIFPNAKPVEFKMSDPAIIPTVPGNLDQLQQQVSNIIAKVEKIPFDKIGEDLRATLASTSKLMGRLDKQVAPEAQKMLKQARDSMAQINALLASDASLPVNTERAMQELGRAARSLRALADFLQANPEALLRGRGPDPIPGAGPVRN